MTLRDMTAREVWTRFGDLTHHGVIVVDREGNIVASIGYKQFDKSIYAHSLEGDGGIAVAMITQYLRHLRNELGLEGVHFAFDEGNSSWDRLIKSGRVRLTGYNAILE